MPGDTRALGRSSAHRCRETQTVGLHVTQHHTVSVTAHASCISVWCTSNSTARQLTRTPLCTHHTRWGESLRGSNTHKLNVCVTPTTVKFQSHAQFPSGSERLYSKCFYQHCKLLPSWPEEKAEKGPCHDIHKEFSVESPIKQDCAGCRL